MTNYLNKLTFDVKAFLITHNQLKIHRIILAPILDNYFIDRLKKIKLKQMYT